ncbi:MAG: NAD(P)H-dependent glycerol-3-phosphate dehydrogenase [Rhodospirillaceae bacterium]
MNIDSIGIIGAGAWGTALAQAVCNAGNHTILWAHEREVADSINKKRMNDIYLPGITLNPAIRATTVIEEATESDVVLLVTPAQFLRGVTETLAPILSRSTPIVICAKGIEQNTGALMSEIASETLGGREIAVLSGPTFAVEVAKGLPTAVTIASKDPAFGEAFVRAIGTQTLRPYHSQDVIGAEIGGAVKNVLAIACGIAEGRGFGDNARAALITRGLSEMTRLSLAKGGKAETMMGLSGLGDLTLTCTSPQSRNYSLGIALGEGQSLDSITSSRHSVAEGVFSAAAVGTLASRLRIEMPISEGIDAIVNKGSSVDEIIEALLARPFREEKDPRR